MPALAAIIDGSFEGLLTVVHKFYYGKFNPADIVAGSSAFQQNMLYEYVKVETEAAKAAKALEALRGKLSEQSRERVAFAFLNKADDKYINIFRYIIAAFKLGEAVDDHEELEYVRAVRAIAYNTGREAHLLKGFVRFRQVGGKGAFYADISPENDVLTILAPHFADRFCGERFVIHDVRRGTAVIYDGRGWVLTDAPPGFSPPEEGDAFIDLWKTFYDTIEIKERRNSKLKKSLVPMRYWKHMTEMKGRQ